jgi:hypothetical protein
MATSPLRKAVALTSAEASSSSAEAASERLRNLLEVFRLLTRLRKKAQEHHTEMKAYAAYGHFPLLRDPNRPDILIDIDESESFLPFVFNATIVFAVTVLDNLLESLQRVLMSSGNQELVVEANVIIGDRSPKSDWGRSGPTRNPGNFRTRYVFVLLSLGLIEEQEVQDAFKQPTDKPIRDKRFAVLELYQKRCAIVHDDPLADMCSNPVDDYGIAYHFVQRLAQKWNESFPHALNHEPTPGVS